MTLETHESSASRDRICEYHQLRFVLLRRWFQHNAVDGGIVTTQLTTKVTSEELNRLDWVAILIAATTERYGWALRYAAHMFLCDVQEKKSYEEEKCFYYLCFLVCFSFACWKSILWEQCKHPLSGGLLPRSRARARGGRRILSFPLGRKFSCICMKYYLDGVFLFPILVLFVFNNLRKTLKNHLV